MTNHVIQPTTLPLSQRTQFKNLLICVSAEGKRFVPESSGRCLGAAGGGIESPPEKINNALVCKWPVLCSQTFKAARVTVAPERSRQVVSERNTFPTDDIIPGMAAARKRAPHTLSPHKIRTWLLMLIFSDVTFENSVSSVQRVRPGSLTDQGPWKSGKASLFSR